MAYPVFALRLGQMQVNAEVKGDEHLAKIAEEPPIRSKLSPDAEQRGGFSHAVDGRIDRP